jgi:hypothetical protein
MSIYTRLAHLALAGLSAIGLIALLVVPHPSSAGTMVHPRATGFPAAFLPLIRKPLSFDLQPGCPAYLANTVNTAGCNWMGITGQAFSLDGLPILGLYVHLEGGGLVVDAPTGGAPSVGPGGYEIVLSDHPIETTDTYRMQLRNASGQPLSDTYVIATFGDCRRNWILVNFEQAY